MSLLSEAITEYNLARGKGRLKEIILQAARNQHRFVDLLYLECHNEFIPSMIEWLTKEGLNVKVEKRNEKVVGFGPSDEDEFVDRVHYIIRW